MAHRRRATALAVDCVCRPAGGCTGVGVLRTARERPCNVEGVAEGFWVWTWGHGSPAYFVPGGGWAPGGGVCRCLADAGRAMRRVGFAGNDGDGVTAGELEGA